jgi:hypothetical protein
VIYVHELQNFEWHESGQTVSWQFSVKKIQYKNNGRLKKTIELPRINFACKAIYKQMQKVHGASWKLSEEKLTGRQ